MALAEHAFGTIVQRFLHHPRPGHEAPRAEERAPWGDSGVGSLGASGEGQVGLSSGARWSLPCFSSSQVNLFIGNPTLFVVVCTKAVPRRHHIRMHYGHPDMTNAHFVRKTGGVSRGSTRVNVNAQPRGGALPRRTRWVKES